MLQQVLVCRGARRQRAPPHPDRKQREVSVEGCRGGAAGAVHPPRRAYDGWFVAGKHPGRANAWNCPRAIVAACHPSRATGYRTRTPAHTRRHRACRARSTRPGWASPPAALNPPPALCAAAGRRHARALEDGTLPVRRGHQVAALVPAAWQAPLDHPPAARGAGRGRRPEGCNFSVTAMTRHDAARRMKPW
jgi:hypothetical protein